MAETKQFHDENRLVRGDRERAACARGQGGDAEVFAGVLGGLVAGKQLVVAGETVHLPGRGIAMKSEESESKQIIEDAFREGGVAVPALKDVLAGMKLDKIRAQQVVTLLLRDKVLVKLADELVFHRTALAQLRERVSRGEEAVGADRCDAVQGIDGAVAEVRDSVIGVAGPGASDEAGRR